MELTDVIAKSLIRAIETVQSDWPNVVQVEAGTEEAMRLLAERPDVNTAQFCRSLFSSRHEFAETLFLCVLPDALRASIAESLKNRKELRDSKEKYVKTREYEKAANCRDSQQEFTSLIADRLAGKTFTITAQCVKMSLVRMGWVEGCS
ncbi:hypothetical protein OAE32_01280 [bacterium]|nr:hypothetical protein [bacterium]